MLFLIQRSFIGAERSEKTANGRWRGSGGNKGRSGDKQKSGAACSFMLELTSLHCWRCYVSGLLDQCRSCRKSATPVCTASFCNHPTLKPHLSSLSSKNVIPTFVHFPLPHFFSSQQNNSYAIFVLFFHSFVLDNKINQLMQTLLILHSILSPNL